MPENQNHYFSLRTVLYKNVDVSYPNFIYDNCHIQTLDQIYQNFRRRQYLHHLSAFVITILIALVKTNPFLSPKKLPKKHHQKTARATRTGKCTDVRLTSHGQWFLMVYQMQYCFPLRLTFMQIISMIICTRVN